MPPTLQGIRDYLQAKLTPYVTRVSDFDQWLDNLFGLKNIFGHVLGLNLYIDLKTGALDELEVANVVNLMVKDSDARRSFYGCVEDVSHQSLCICQHRNGQQVIDHDRYVRIMPFTSMVQYYCRSLTKTYSPEAEAEVERMFYSEDRAERFPLGLLTGRWRGRMDNVWVTSKSDVDEILSLSIAPEKKATCLRTRLGFYEYDRGRLVFVAYPPDVDFFASFQPTSLDANSGCFFFVSKGNLATETWGETCSLNSSFPGMRERVHHGFQGLTDAFESEIIGYVEPEITDTNHLLHTAWSRVP
jgi:hypothetical protein